MAQGVELPNCNLYLKGSKYDTNGNKVVSLTFPNSRGFSIQTGGNLKKTGSILRGKKTLKDMRSLSSSELKTIGREVVAYLKKHGSSTQKKKLRLYK